ncbi:MAG TPA: NAD-dependent succinate-semialdehyde dehydrogenase [Gammaproteobacteria bacterium]|nr:NAD-dependent succinate-semialdehyde dehydrogenase [Gammaproteobacteria bacterium]
MPIQTINPATGAVIETYNEMNEAAAFSIIEKVQTAFTAYQHTSFDERRACFQRLHDGLNEQLENFAELMTQEMGKPITQSRAEIQKCLLLIEHYIQYGEIYLKPKPLAPHALVCYQPLGTIFGIMPWNFPLWQVFRFAVPTLMAGNTAILKHAPISTGCAYAIEALFQAAFAIKDVFRAIVVNNEVASAVIPHPHIKAVTLTGSARAGKSVAKEAGDALKKVVLELGGSDPYLILADADLENAAEACAFSRLWNAGQVCIAAKRIIVVKSVLPAFLSALKEKMKSYQPSDPLAEATTLGPLARADLRENLHRQVTLTVSQGATLHCGGEMPAGPGFYYPVTLLTNVKPGMCAFEEEVFGPVFSIIEATDENEAIQLANNTVYGLTAAVFTRDLARGEAIARNQLQAGCVAVNRYAATEPALPFGGINQSGFGRELGESGARSFVNEKTVLVSA